MRIPILNQDAVGIIKDVKPYDLPLNAFSGGNNVRFTDGHVERMLGYQEVFTPAVDPLFLMPVRTAAGYHWLYAGSSAVYAYSGASVNISRGTPYAAVGNTWTGGVLNGIPVLNNPNDVPQMWSSNGSTPPDGVTLLANLANWPGTWTCRSLRPFKNFLVALGVKKGGTDYPYLVNWSHPADPGNVPNSWDIADATKDAGEVPLAETDGKVVDQLTLGNVNVIYKEDAAYAMTHIGGIDIFAFPRIKNASGLLMPNGVKSFNPPNKPEHHIVFGKHDVYVHDGGVINTILRGRLRNWLYKNLDQLNYGNSFIVHYPGRQEIWVCFPQVGETFPNVALVWDYRLDTTTIKDLPSTAFIEAGTLPYPETAINGDTWAAAAGTWGDDTEQWGGASYAEGAPGLIMVTTGTGRKGYVADSSSTAAGAPIAAFVERVGLTVLGKDARGALVMDTETNKLLTEVWPRMTGDVGTLVNIFVGTQMAQDQPVSWEGPFEFRIGIDEKIDPFVMGKILSVRFECAAVNWTLSGYDINVQPAGRY